MTRNSIRSPILSMRICCSIYMDRRFPIHIWLVVWNLIVGTGNMAAARETVLP